jgi:hypothetical protein
MTRLSVLLLISFSLLSCRNEEVTVALSSIKIELKNASSQNTRFLFFDFDGSVYKEALINSGDSIIIEEGVINPAPDGPTYSITMALDSAQIIFPNMKKLIQTKGENRTFRDTVNSVLHETYYKRYSEGNFTRMQFTLTEEDYLRAQ